jgi:multiple sugar transport system ATP-binding protein
MTVFDNMAFGLRMRKVPSPEIKSTVTEAAHFLGIQDLLQRKPRQLSGGQRQRVALGRAIVRKPQLFLFDEPLSNLDAQLRVDMRTELKKLHQRLQATIIYVTHDQIEAMTMADRIVIMKDGVIHQVGAPMDVYSRPVNRFVAGFIGSPSMNFIPCSVESRDGKLFFANEGLRIGVPRAKASALGAYAGKAITLGIRPEDLQQAQASDPVEAVIDAVVNVIEPLGHETLLELGAGPNRLLARFRPDLVLAPGQAIRLSANLDKLHAFDMATDMAIG